MNDIRQQIIEKAQEIGFDLVGFSPTKIEQKYLDAYENWLKKNFHGDMKYMEKIDQRRDLQNILPGAKSAIALAVNYYKPETPLKENHGRIANYATSRDYHKIIGKMLKELTAYIETIAPQSKNKYYVDTGPILERAVAEQAGIGRIGKNSLLITSQFGSWVFLSEIITTLDLVEKKQTINTSPLQKRWQNHQNQPFNICGNCTRCIDACPTNAIIAPGVIDSRLCISYLTIENKDKIPPELAKIIKDLKLLYGCDICQQVCPHNQARQQKTTNKQLATPLSGDQISLKKVKKIKTHQDMIKTFAGSPIMRAKHTGLNRNADVLLD